MTDQSHFTAFNSKANKTLTKLDTATVRSSSQFGGHSNSNIMMQSQ